MARFGLLFLIGLQVILNVAVVTGLVPTKGLSLPCISAGGSSLVSTMLAGGILVNVARGGVVDDDALIAALDQGRVATAILDVFHTEPLPEDDPLWAHPGVRLTPHTSFAGDGVQGRWDALFLDNIARFARGEPLEREVDPGAL